MNVISRDASNYAYVNARVKSRRAVLFDEDDYRTLMRMGTSEIARFLEESEYEAEVNDLGSRFSGVDLVEYALNRNLAKHFHDLLQWSQGTLRDLLVRYFRKFDAWNVKTALRGVYADTETAEIEQDFIRAGDLGDDTLSLLADADEIRTVVDLLSETLFGPALDDAYGEYEETNSLVPLENAVDLAFYDRLLKQVQSTSAGTREFVKFLQADIDFRNVRNAVRLARSGADLDPAEYYIEGGRLFEPAELDALADNWDELVARLRDSHYGNELADKLDELDEADSLIAFEHALDAALLSYSEHLSHVFPLSVCPVLGYVLAKEREVDNVRAIARGREVGLTEEEIEEELVIL
ncbi:V-type ATP synthase subunit C [Salarchaeum sp. JOR-1]|uniref:V-type ATP synthase subunit C n=1 Tax=Salarchaeum sp. JOR-1 TaxID=2599399 RepID=UPI0011985959|nr:V-type ATP synthase subunit C [Salarchaeum sp. JOR-1]QDX40376.1 V-type ATP synthase subunit C [Salarchaeum sp. JOR-1]